MTSDRLSHLDSHPEEAGKGELALAAAFSLVLVGLIAGLAVCGVAAVLGLLQ